MYFVFKLLQRLKYNILFINYVQYIYLSHIYHIFILKQLTLKFNKQGDDVNENLDIGLNLCRECILSNTISHI